LLTFDNFLSLDSTLELELIHSQNWNGPITGVSLIDNPKAHHLLFIKNKNYWQSFLMKQDSLDIQNLGIVFDKKLFQEIRGSEHFEKLINRVGAIFSTNSVDFSMCAISLPLFEEKYQQRNSWVDGRQMGTVNVHPSAKIAQGVFIGENVSIAAFCQVFPGCVLLSGSSLAENTILYPHVTLYEDTYLGKNCRIHSGTVIGADGFGYNYKNGIHHKLWHIGNVEIGDDVEIGANSAIDRGTFSSTRIGSGSKIDNLVQIGHNCQIGKGVILCGQVGVAGSAVIEDYCVLGGKAGVGPGVKIGQASQVAGAAQVNHDWPANSVIAGHPARPLKEWLRGLATLRKLSLNKKNQNETGTRGKYEIES